MRTVVLDGFMNQIPALKFSAVLDVVHHQPAGRSRGLGGCGSGGSRISKREVVIQSCA